MKRILFFLLCTSAIVFAQQPSGNGESSPAPADNPALSGQKIFEKHCKRCHAADGSSNTFIGRRWKIPDLRSDKVQKLSVEERIEIITQGKEKMPAHKNKLTPEEILAVEGYVRELGKKASPPAQ
ncbi:MAG TPA: c-type cytochrome [Terriglobales bacterium]|jgi:mono/diheme cytochrome c family protein|nr:c-type cytochrome [Terriglobales bacterium]